MERLQLERTEAAAAIVGEHRHRYHWAACHAVGDVCDISCGEGYGAAILTASPQVRSYIGIDASAVAVARARDRFAGHGRRFVVGSATAIPLPSASIDTVVSLETLEHLPAPQQALDEYRRILAPTGVLVGSVPTRYFDERAFAVYGPNPYHVTRFGYEDLVELLQSRFRTVRIGFSALHVVSQIGEVAAGRMLPAAALRVVGDAPAGEIAGSFHFVAFDREPAAATAAEPDYWNQLHFCTPLIEHDARSQREVRDLQARLRQVEDALGQAEQLVREKDRVLAQAAELLRLKDESLATAAELLSQKDAVIAQAEGLIRERDALLARRR